MEQEINDSSQRTPSHQSVTTDTNTPRTPLNNGVNLTPNSLSSIRVRQIHSPSPTVNSESTTRPTPRSSIEETSQDHRVTIEPGNLDSESDSDSSNSSLGLLQWRQKVQNADSSAYKKSMAQDEYDWGPSFTYGDFEDILQESNMEKTNRMIQRMQQRQDAESRLRNRSPATPSSASRDSSASRNSSADRNGARSRNYSGTSVDTGGDYSSGQEEYFSAGEEEK